MTKFSLEDRVSELEDEVNSTKSALDAMETERDEWKDSSERHEAEENRLQEAMEDIRKITDRFC